MSIIKLFKEKLLCPIISSFIIIITAFLVSCVIIYPMIAGNELRASKAIDDITNKVDEQLKYCGGDYWTTWIVVDQSKKTFKFQNVRGLNKDETVIVSPKDAKLNTYYLSTHPVDKSTLNFLSNFETGAAGFYPDLSFFDDKETAKNIIESPNKKVYKVGISVTKNIFNNLVYVFITTLTKPEFGKCDKTKIVYDLEDLSIYAKGKL